MTIQGIVPNGKKNIKFTEVDRDIEIVSYSHGKLNLSQNSPD